jgi:sarcosine oxidase
VKREFDHVILGLGGIGSAAAYWLARRGATVLGLERFEIGHTNGASEDHSRIIRRSYHTPRYVRLAGQAYRTWEEVEGEAGERLIVRTGGLDLFPEGAAIPIRDYTESMDACDVRYARLDAAETMQRWPQWRLPEEVRILYQEDAGIAAASRCNAAHRRLARERGAVLRDHARVTDVRSVDGEVEVLVDRPDGRTAIRCAKLVVAADAWTNEVLASLDVSLPLTITQEQVVYLACPDPAAFAPERFPIWIWMDDPSFYGFPSFGEPGPKAAQDVGGKEVTPETRTYARDEAAFDRVRSFVERYLPGAVGPVLSLRTCLYAMPPDRDFVLDWVPGHPNVLVALGAAHGFKFTSLFGRILADLATDGATDHDIEGFEADRPILTMEDPPRSFLI